MSETLYFWLNNELKLSEKITNIQTQFSNGFFFGEILSKYELLPQFNEFNNTNNKLHITKNYSLLQKKFSDLGINLTEIEKNDLIQKKKFKAEIFLYKIKQKLSSMLLNINEIFERTKNKNNNLKTFYKSLNMGNFNNVVKKFEVKNEKIAMLKEKEKINEKRKKLKSARLPKINKFEKNLNDFYMKNNNNNFNNNFYNKNMINNIINDNKNIENEIKNKKEKIFQLENSKHKENINKEKEEILHFNENIKILNDFKKKSIENQNKQNKFYSNVVENSFKKSFNDNKIIINEFDENLQKLGLDMKLIDPKLEKLKGKTISTEIFMQKIKEQVNLKEKQKKMDDIRKRRIQSAKNNNFTNKINNNSNVFNRPKSGFSTTNTNNVNFSKKSTRPQ
jgi:PIN domain nuclease of toxin-antitoxin system